MWMPKPQFEFAPGLTTHVGVPPAAPPSAMTLLLSLASPLHPSAESPRLPSWFLIHSSVFSPSMAPV